MRLTLFLAVLLLNAIPGTFGQSEYWHHFGNNEKGHRYSPLTQINRSNAKHLQVAWTYRYGKVGDGSYAHEVTPIMVDDGSGRGRDVLILCTPWNHLIALNPLTGTEIWKQTGSEADDPSYYDLGPRTCRGVTTWVDPLKKDGDYCRRVVYMGNLGAILSAFDAATGGYCKNFGDGGKVNLTVRGSIISKDGRTRQIYGFATAPQVVRDTVVIGDSLNDYAWRDRPHGQPRGLDCRTGRIKWKFDVIPQDESDPAWTTWHNDTKNVGGGNVWAPIGADDETGIVYLATSSPHFDYWGGNRQGQNEYTDSVVALDANSGKKIWHYQIIKHDLWNYDLAAQPIVTTITHKGSRKKAVLQLTKTGMLFILDAISGVPLYEVEERQVPKSPMPDDNAWPTQSFPVGDLGNLTVTEFTLDDLFDPEDDPNHKEYCRNRTLGQFKIPGGRGKIFTPASTDYGTFNIPGDLGGANWMSFAVQPHKQLAVMPLNNVLVVRQLLRRNERSSGHCSSRPMTGSPYHACQTRYFSPPPLQYPCIKPPWARLAAVDLSTGRLKWMRPFATPLGYPLILKKEYGARRVMGGVIVTASDLVIGTGGEDMRLWIYDLETGDEIWGSDMMEYDPTSVPMTYYTGGRQFIVLNAGGHWTSPTPRGDMIYAYSLPENYTKPVTTTNPTVTRIFSHGTQLVFSRITVVLVYFITVFNQIFL